MAVKANIIKVKVDPKDLKAIPDILPYRQLLQGDPMELELTKKEICRCMNFGDVYDLSSGEEVLIDEIAFKAIEEYVEEEASEDEPAGDDTTEEGGNTSGDAPSEGQSQIEENSDNGVVPGAVGETVITK